MPSLAIVAMSQDWTPGRCVICDEPCPRGRWRLCGSKECARTYNTLAVMYRRTEIARELQDEADMQVPALVENAADQRALDEFNRWARGDT